MFVKDIIKIEITQATDGFIIEAHGSNSKGKVFTDTYACETQASVMRKLPDLIRKLQQPNHAEA